MTPPQVAATLSIALAIGAVASIYPIYQKIQDRKIITALASLGPCHGSQPPESEFQAALEVVQRWNGLNREGQRIALTRLELARRQILGCGFN